MVALYRAFWLAVCHLCLLFPLAKICQHTLLIGWSSSSNKICKLVNSVRNTHTVKRETKLTQQKSFIFFFSPISPSMEKIIFVGKELKSLKTSLDLIGNALGEFCVHWLCCFLLHGEEHDKKCLLVCRHLSLRMMVPPLRFYFVEKTIFEIAMLVLYI